MDGDSNYGDYDGGYSPMMSYGGYDDDDYYGGDSGPTQMIIMGALVILLVLLYFYYVDKQTNQSPPQQSQGSWVPVNGSMWNPATEGGWEMDALHGR